MSVSASNHPLQSLEQRRVRVDLAAAFRIVARLGWQDAVANHFSVAVSQDGRHFLMNPACRHFSRLRASDLQLLDAETPDERIPAGIDRTAWAIHRTLHAELPQARCIMHLHPPYATALSCLADCEIKPIDQTSARFFRRVAVDERYGGMVDNLEEGLRLVAALADKRVLIMRNHGVLVVHDTIAAAFDEMYHLEGACRTLMLAYASGRPLVQLSDEVAERTAGCWEADSDYGRAHFDQWKQILDSEEASYAQ